MPEVNIRQIETDEEILYDFMSLTNYAFRPTPPTINDEERSEMLPTGRERRIVVAYEDGQPRATAAALDMTQNVRGKIYGMGGISPVATHPMGRRQGYARQSLVTLFGIMREAGHVFTGLHPFRESFYERLGYVTFPRIQRVDFDTANLGKLLKMNIPGDVQFQRIKAGYEAIFAPFLQRMQAQTHGMSLKGGLNARLLMDKDEFWLASVQFDGVVEGLMLYQIKGFGGEFDVSRFLTLSSRARYALLAYIARHIDHTKVVTMRLRHEERPQTWLSDMLPRANPDIWLTPMGRVLDVAQVGGMQVGEGAFTARIIDAQCEWNNGTWSFVSEGGTLHVAPAEDAEVDLTIQGLGALLYGTHDPHDFVFRGWGDPSPELIARLEMMFPRQNPYMFEPY